jgi:O-antigen/teichoic acid export membrane protein
VSDRLERQALSLGTANAIDFALQFLVPIVLARTLDADSFGQYRLLWLAIGTVMVVTTLSGNVHQGLYYFLPRSDRETRRLYINQTLVFLAVGGLLSAWFLSPWNPWLPESMRDLGGHEVVVPAFVLLWVLASLLDLLPTVDERVSWQAWSVVGLSILRAAALSLAAILTHDLQAVLAALLACVAVKLALLLYYMHRHHGLGRPFMRWRLFLDQLRHALPFGASSVLYRLRPQADQWIAAALFPLTQFAAFSIAGVLGPMVLLFRQSFNHVFLPSMSRSHAEGDMAAMLALNNRANMTVAALCFPLLAFCFVFADPLITLVYTSTYASGVPVMRVYIVSLVPFTVELYSVMLLLREGAFAMRLNAPLLAISAIASLAGALAFGLAGAATGSVITIFLDRFLTLRRIARVTGFRVPELQDWTGLAAVTLAAAVAAATAGATVFYGLELSASAAQLAAGALIVALVYPCALFLAGQRRLMTNLAASLLNTRQPAQSATGAKG